MSPSLFSSSLHSGPSVQGRNSPKIREKKKGVGWGHQEHCPDLEQKESPSPSHGVCSLQVWPTPPAQSLDSALHEHTHCFQLLILNYSSGPALGFIAFIYYKKTSVCFFLKRLSGQITVDKQH